MKIIIILATGALLTFPTVDHKIYYKSKPDCFTQGYKVLEKLATYQGPEERGEDQGWYLNGTKMQVGGWYCQ